MRRRLAKETAVVARRIFRGSNPQCSSVLQSSSPRVTRFNDQLLNRIETMKATAIQHRLVSLSSNQIEMKHNSFCIVNRRCEQVKKWSDPTFSASEDYEVFINPQVTDISSTTNTAEESCPSYPFLLCAKQRFDEVQVEYRTSEKETASKTLRGFGARVFQHEFDHLVGNNLLFSQVHRGNLRIDPTVEPQFPRTVDLLKDLNTQVKKMLKQYPHLFPKVTVRSINDGTPDSLISFEQDLLRRLLKHYKKQLALYEARLSLASN